MKSISKTMFLAVLALGFAGCRTATTFSTKSVAPPETIHIDGSADDWRGHLFVEGERLETGFLNDQENLYVCLLTKYNLTRAEILTQGLTVWFDPEGGKNKVFGIKFPVGLPSGEQKVTLRETREGPKLENLPENIPMTDLEILRGKEPPRKLPVADAKGIEVKVRSTPDEIVYELKIPLASSEEHPFAVGTEPGKTIGVGFESPKLEASVVRPKRPKERPPEGQEGGEEGAGEAGEGGEAGEAGEGGWGQEGRGGYGRESQPQVPLEVWAVVHLVES